MNRVLLNISQFKQSSFKEGIFDHIRWFRDLKHTNIHRNIALSTILFMRKRTFENKVWR